MKKLKTNALFKLILWATAAVTAAAMIKAGAGALFLGEYLFSDDITYYDTHYYTGRLYRLADLVRVSVQEDMTNTLDVQLDDSCLSTAVYESYDMQKDRYTAEYSYSESGEHEKNGETVFAVADDGSLYQFHGPRQLVHGDRIILTTDETIARDADFKTSYSMFHTFYPIRKTLIAVLIGGALLELIILILLCICTGHISEREEIYLYPFPDRLPGEVLLAALLGAVAAAALVMREGISYLYEYSGLTAVYCTAAMGSFLFCLCQAVLLSFVRRLKARMFWQTSILGRICVFLYGLVREIPFIPKTAAILTALLAVNLAAIFSYEEEILLFAACTDVIAFLAMMFQAVQCRKLADAAAAIAAGNTGYRIPEQSMKWMIPDLKKHAGNLNSIADGVQLAVEKQMKSEHLKTELITNVSHDIRTPLTSIINYTDLLQKEHTDEEGQQYLQTLARNADRLKKLTEDLIEASKASTGNISASLQPVSVREMFEQALAEYQEKLEKARLTPVVNIQEDAGHVLADGILLWRVLSNLLSNCVKYALPGTRLYLDASRQNDTVCIAVKNISSQQLNISAEELMERFVRGDRSRTTEGSGLGLNIARSLMEIMNGSLRLTVDGDFFKAEMVLPYADMV